MNRAMNSDSVEKRHRGWLSGYRGLLFMLGFATLIAVPIVALHAAHQRVNLVSYLAMVWVSVCYGIGYQSVFSWVLPRLGPEPDQIHWRHAVQGAVATVVAILIGGSLTELTLPLLNWSADQHWWVGGGVIVLVRLVHLDYERLTRRVRETELREERAQHQAARAELDALTNRVDPHFLFNSLNTIAGLIEESPQRAVDVVTRLAGFYQQLIRAGRDRSVPLTDELTAAATYLEIQALRFEGRFAYEVEECPQAENIRVPTLCLQPLVENAVLHGTSGTESSPRRITVRARLTGENLLLQVEDDGPGPDASRHHGNGTALNDLGERLLLTTEGHATLRFGRRESGGFRAEIELQGVERVR